ncbi:DedA family protein [Salinicola halophyticus]|uniref:DedA family protein n=1 Tax=Salinicola halophyticus TaxID=1808881 RepID=UPI003F45F8A4
MIDFVLHLDQYLEILIQQYGIWVYGLLFVVLFCETGFVVTPFLPGDSLLFIAGAFAALGSLNPWLLGILLFLAAVLGDTVNYWIGRTWGTRLFANPDSKVFRRDYLLRTEDFYARHGGKMVTLARFVPIIRTFAPFVAGLGHMRYAPFLSFNMLGALLWISILLSLGYFFGNISFLKHNIDLFSFGIIVISLLPVAFEMLRHRLSKSSH